jgi:hypothetical protein
MAERTEFALDCNFHEVCGVSFERRHKDYRTRISVRRRRRGKPRLYDGFIGDVSRSFRMTKASSWLE